MGLRSHLTSGITIARLPKMKHSTLREPGQFPGSFYLNLSICSFDKGKPVERRGRKAMGPPFRLAQAG